ncbi:hypothetical protein AYL99_11810 [Fonsecaea erecta]|uniref:Uncharacterized protein n=1 Tax=Fonsecaea erecta TaxID=1367422 RepID=A0A178Z2D4_9EURO|nr:hypothetical protein AYL99_11810 [Fonsecaea erecta]OAP53930.1 hypothetical protein AYL99_11810 [Fonsecaea erecta]
MFKNHELYAHTPMWSEMCRCEYTICYKCLNSRETVSMCRGGSSGMCITKHSYKFWYTHMDWYGTMPTGSVKILFCGNCVVENEAMGIRDSTDVCGDVPPVMRFYRNLIDMGMTNLTLERAKYGFPIHYDTEDRPMNVITFVQTHITPPARTDSLTGVGTKKFVNTDINGMMDTARSKQEQPADHAPVHEVCLTLNTDAATSTDRLPDTIMDITAHSTMNSNANEGMIAERVLPMPNCAIVIPDWVPSIRTNMPRTLSAYVPLVTITSTIAAMSPPIPVEMTTVDSNNDIVCITLKWDILDDDDVAMGSIWYRHNGVFTSSITMRDIIEHSDKNIIVCMVVVKIRQMSSGELIFILLDAIESSY